MIEINNLTTNTIDQGFFKNVVEKVLEKELSSKKEIELSIALIGEKRMRELNKRYRGKNKVTDVLSFSESEVLLEKFKVGPRKAIAGLGEIIICLQRTKKNAKRNNISFKEEMSMVLIHGTLHLLGYDHEQSKEKEKQMIEKQEHYLSEILN